MKPLGLYPPAGGRGEITLVEGSTFCICDTGGDIRPTHTQGLFVRDIRVLTTWELLVNGRPVRPLTVVGRAPFTARFVSTAQAGADQPESTLLVLRDRYVGNGMREDLLLRNMSSLPVAASVSFRLGTDFADLFEVKTGAVSTPGAVNAEIGDGRIRLELARGANDFAVVIDAEGEPALHDTELSWPVSLDPRSEWSASIEVHAERDGQTVPLHHPRHTAVAQSVPARRLHTWRTRSPTVQTGDPGLARVLRCTVEDIGALRIFDPEHADTMVVAAGAPWFMALYGRDALLTSWMVLPLGAELALGTVRALAERQGTTFDAESEEEPGRILHEVRLGLPQFGSGTKGAYYGTADATALFVALVGELVRWGHLDQVRDLLPNVDRALDWIENHGDRDGDGFVEYARSTPRGLLHQGWKDSFDGVNFADGTPAEPPIALAEVQAYSYAAYRARADIARALGDRAGQSRWRSAADGLRARFDEQFWCPDRGWYAIGLDADKRRIDALASNIGHCLWTGVVPVARAAELARHLASPAMFTGWGVRTLATDMAAYNPVSYHNGSVWPHDSAICAAGLMRYGYVDLAQRIALGLLDASRHFGDRLPELFCGFDRGEFGVPVPYPAACMPQACAAAAPLLLLRTLVHLEPDLTRNRVACRPEVPGRLLPLRVSGLRIGPHEVAVDVGPDRWTITGLDGVDVVAGLRH